MIQPIEEHNQAERGWTVWLDGQVLPRVCLLELSNPAVGNLQYGWISSGYDCWSYRENAGGGVVIVPYAQIDGKLLVGVIQEDRPNQGGRVFNLPKGSVGIGETHQAAAQRELAEETGLLNVVPEELPGEPLNPDPTFYDTSKIGTGARAFRAPLPPEWLERRDSNWTVSENHLDVSKQAISRRRKEGIGRLFFISRKDAVQLGDMFTVAAVARLTALLEW